MPKKSNTEKVRLYRQRKKLREAGLAVEYDEREEDKRWELRWKELGYDKMVEEYEKKEVNAWEDCYRSSSHKLREWLAGEAPTTRYVKQAGNRRGDK